MPKFHAGFGAWAMTGLLAFTLFHVVISLAAIGLGLIWLKAVLAGRLVRRLTAWFLAFTAATSLTGFLFPFHGFTPALGVGILSTLLLAAAYGGFYVFKLAGPWRAIFVTAAVASLYFNCFVLVVQSFLKIPALHLLAPTGSEPPFAATQGVLLLAFLVAGYLSLRRLRTATA